MTDRLTDLIVGLQRMAENARLRTDDLEYVQREERHELIRYLDQLLMMTDKLRASLLDDRKRLMPVEREHIEAMPRVVTKGPTTAAAVAQIKKVERDEQQRSTQDRQTNSGS